MPGGWWNRIAIAVLPVVAAVGAVLSWGSLYEAAARGLGAHAPTPFGINLVGAAFPLLVDALILGASARYVAGVQTGRPVGGWRLAAHCGVAGTVALNAAAAPRPADIPWHVTAPIVWSVLVELVARDVLGELRAAQPVSALGRIPVRLWVTAPAESVRISWRIARTGAADPDAARAQTERCAAARDHLAVVHPGPARWRMRRQISRRLWAGALDPAALTELVERHDDPRGLHRAVLRVVAADRPAAPDPMVPAVPSLVESAPGSVFTPDPVPTPVPDLAQVPDRVPPPDPTPDLVPTVVPAGSVPAESVPAASRRESDDLATVVQAVTDGQISGRVTKAKIREHLRCSNPHAGTVNALYHEQANQRDHHHQNGRNTVQNHIPSRPCWLIPRRQAALVKSSRVRWLDRVRSRGCPVQ